MEEKVTLAAGEPSTVSVTPETVPTHVPGLPPAMQLHRKPRVPSEAKSPATLEDWPGASPAVCPTYPPAPERAPVFCARIRPELVIVVPVVVPLRMLVN